MNDDALIFVVEDDDSLRRSLARLLESEGWNTETFATAEEYLARERHRGPSCLLLDHHLPGVTGLALQQQLAEGSREEQIIFVTGVANVPGCVQAMKGGAIDYLSKPFRDEELLAAIRRALERSAEHWRHLHERRLARKRIELLTPREFQVLRYVIGGMLNKQIADELGTGLATVKAHRGSLTQKLGLTSVADLVRLTQQAGVLPFEKATPRSNTQPSRRGHHEA